MKIVYITDGFPRKSHLYSGIFPYYLMTELAKKTSLKTIFSEGKFSKVWFKTLVKSIINILIVDIIELVLNT